MVAKTIQQFLKESQAVESLDILQAAVMELGYKDIKKESGTRFSILIDGNRMDVINKLVQHLASFGAYHDPNFGSSSIGMVRIGAKYAIGVKPKSRQGKASAGIDNETTLIQMVNDACKNGALNIVFSAGTKKFTIPFAVRAEGVGGDTAGGKKSDVNIFDKDGNVYPISVKKDKAEYWQSADSFAKQNDLWKVILKAQKSGEISIKPHPKKNSVFQISPEVAFMANAKETQTVVFGTDILGKGCVVEKTFTGAYKLDAETETMHIEVSSIVSSMRDLKDKQPYFLFRNDSSRSASVIPGVRVLAAYKSRINKNVKVVKR